jgi:hypothetical protein
MEKMTHTRLWLLAALTAVLCIIAIGSAYAQVPYYLLQNEYVWMKFGIEDASDPWPPISEVPGRFLIGTILGDPENPNDDGSPYPMFGYWDWGAMQYEQMYLYTDPVTNVQYLKEGGIPSGMWGTAMIRVKDLNLNAIIGDPAQGGWNYSPYTPVYPQEMRAEWNVNLPQGQNATGGKILIRIKYNLRRDMVRQEYTLVNTDTVVHQVGLRMIWDACSGVDYGNAGDWVQGIVPGYGTLPLETDLTGLSVPPYAEYCMDPVNPNMIIRNVFKAQAGVYASDATSPDRVVVGEWSELASTLWDYSIRPWREIADRAVSAWWNPVTLNPNASRTFVTYYGVGAATSDLRSPFVLSVQGPRALKYDELQPAGLSPDPMTISAYIYNYLMASNGTPIDIKKVTLYLTLPKGLILDDGETPTKSLASIGPLGEGKVTWNIRATGEVAGELVYSVTATGGGVTSKTVSRSIVVPQIQSVNYVSGLQMVSVPFDFADPDPVVALGLPSTSASLYRYNPNTNKYDTVDTLTPGQGFWLNCKTAKQLGLTGATPLSGDSTVVIPIYSGWNQIGNPYIYNMQWARVQVLYERSGLGPVSIDEASQRGWIRPTLYWYDINTRAYGSSSNRTTQLVPGKGYWLRALVPCKLVIPPIDQLGSGIT